MPEQKEQPTSSLPQPEWKHDFSPGPSEEELARFKGPEFRSELPDIQMRFQEGEEKKDEFDYLRWMTSGRGITTSVNKLIKTLSNYEKAQRALGRMEGIRERAEEIEDEAKKKKRIEEIDKKIETIQKEKEARAERVGQHYSTVMGQCLDSVSLMFDESIDQKKNPYPYDHRTPKITIETVREAFEGLADEAWFKSPEGRLWLKRAERDLGWTDAFLQLSVAQAVSLPYYYDVVLQLQVLKESRFRAYATAETFEKAYAERLPGLEFTENEQEIINQKKVGIEIKSDIEAQRPREKGAEFVGLRELATRMQDDCFDIRMRIAAVSQADLNDSKPSSTTFMKDSLTETEFNFYHRLLIRGGVDKDTGKVVLQHLSPYIDSDNGKQREAAAIIETLLLSNATRRLKQISARPADEQGAEIDALLNEVQAETKKRMDNWFSRDRSQDGKRSLVSQLAALITRQGYLQDYSFMHAYRYCWAFKWETDVSKAGEYEIKDGEVRRKPLKREVATGSINTPAGDIYSLYWARRAHGYDLESNSRTQLLPPTDKSMRVSLRHERYDWMPPYNPDGHHDEFLRQQWNNLFSDEPQFVKWRKDRGYPDIPVPIKEILKKWAWVWRTPYPLKLLGENLADDKKLEIAMFMPHGFAAANFFENVRESRVVAGGEEQTKEEKTIWDWVIQGTSLSQIDWSAMDIQQVDRWLVDQEMGSRFMRILIEPFDAEKDAFYGLVTNAPSTLGPKEAAKRLRLCFRDSDTPYSMYEVAFIPFLVTLACANKWGITSPEAWEHSSLTSEEVAKTTYTKVDRFLEEMAYWRRAFAWLPGERSLVGRGTTKGKEKKNIWEIQDGEDFIEEEGEKRYYAHYGKVMGMLGEFYQNVILRFGKASAEDAFALSNSIYDRAIRDYKGKGFEFLRRGNTPPYEPRIRDLKK